VAFTRRTSLEFAAIALGAPLLPGLSSRAAAQTAVHSRP
jgi:hypothetical protein